MDDTPTVNVKEIVVAILQKTGWNQKELADKMAVPEVYISRWVTGRNRPSSDNVVALKRRLDVDHPSLSFPFHVRIPRSSIQVSIDSEYIDIHGLIEAVVKKEGI